jgi:hypothetical protein
MQAVRQAGRPAAQEANCQPALGEGLGTDKSKQGRPLLQVHHEAAIDPRSGISTAARGAALQCSE